jgi:hypothetical protein
MCLLLKWVLNLHHAANPLITQGWKEPVSSSKYLEKTTMRYDEEAFCIQSSIHKISVVTEIFGLTTPRLLFLVKKYVSGLRHDYMSTL